MRDGIVILTTALVLAACGGAATSEGDADQAAAPSEDVAASEEMAATEAPATGEATVSVAATSLGEVIVDGEGMTLYRFENDQQGESACYDSCAETWPPLIGPATAGDGADGALLGTVERDDGQQQVTYDGWPLYYYASDSAPGDVTGHGVGDVWFAVDAAGEDAQAQTGSEDKDARGGRDYDY